MGTIPIGDQGAFLADAYRGGARPLKLASGEEFVGATRDGARIVIRVWEDESASARIIDVATTRTVATVPGNCSQVTPRDTLLCVQGDFYPPEGGAVPQVLVEASAVDGATLASRELAAADSATRAYRITFAGDTATGSVVMLHRSPPARFTPGETELIGVDRALHETWRIDRLADGKRAWFTSTTSMVVYTETLVLAVDPATGRELSRQPFDRDRETLLPATDGFFILRDKAASTYDATGKAVSAEGAPGGAMTLSPQSFDFADQPIYDRASIELSVGYAALVVDASGRLIAYSRFESSGKRALLRASDGAPIEIDLIAGVGFDGTFMARTLVSDRQASGLEVFDLASGAVLLAVAGSEAATPDVRDGIMSYRGEEGTTVVLLPGA